MLKQTKLSLAYKKMDRIKKEQVASNGTLELTELGGKERSPGNGPYRAKPAFIFKRGLDLFHLLTVLHRKDFQF